MWLSPNEVCIGVAVSVKISVHVLLQYQSKSYYIIGQEVYYSIGRFDYIIGQLLQYRAFLLHYRAVITVSGVYYIIGWYNRRHFMRLNGVWWKMFVRRKHTAIEDLCNCSLILRQKDLFQ